MVPEVENIQERLSEYAKLC